jgi:hypothetical protein
MEYQELLYDFGGGRSLHRAKGNFDVYQIIGLHPRWGERYHAPLDTEYFSDMYYYALELGTQKVWDDFMVVWNLVGYQRNREHYQILKELVSGYPDPEEAHYTFMLLYFTMWAEMNKNQGKLPLKKYIKLLGLHRVLFDKPTKGPNPKDPVKGHIDNVCNALRGKGTPNLVLKLRARGFIYAPFPPCTVDALELL